MAKTNLNRDQVVVTRLFIDRVLNDDDLFGDSPGNRRTAYAFCCQLLGYQVLPNGSRIPLGVEVKTKFGKEDPFEDYPDQYLVDGAKLKAEIAAEKKDTLKQKLKELIDEAKAESAAEACTSEPTENK